MIYLSTKERDFTMAIGALLKAAENGLGPAELSLIFTNCDKVDIVKEAQNWVSAPLQLPILASLFMGIPLGAAAHGIHQKVKRRRIEEKALQDKIDYYRNLSNELELGLQNGAA